MIKPANLIQLDNLFKKQNWSIEKNANPISSKYERFCRRLKKFSDKEQSFMINLAESFDYIELESIIECFLCSYSNISDNILKGKKKIIFTPLVTPFLQIDQGENKIENKSQKSAELLFELISRNNIRWIYYGDKFEFIFSIKQLTKQYTIKDTLVIVIDDFIGTGETAHGYFSQIIQEISNNKQVELDDFCILSIVAQNEGVEFVKQKCNIQVYSNIIKGKAITDKYIGNDLIRYLTKMDGMESKISIPNSLKLGYGKSEALVSIFDKSPNNTLPVFWHETKLDPAPFPRYSKFKMENENT